MYLYFIITINSKCICYFLPYTIQVLKNDTEIYYICLKYSNFLFLFLNNIWLILKVVWSQRNSSEDLLYSSDVFNFILRHIISDWFSCMSIIYLNCWFWTFKKKKIMFKITQYSKYTLVYWIKYTTLIPCTDGTSINFNWFYSNTFCI